MKVIESKFIRIPDNRQRREFDPDQLMELATSISKLGLLHPIVVRQDEAGQVSLVAGERRLRALHYIWNMGESVKYGTIDLSEGKVPCNNLGEMDHLDAMEAELEENIQRSDLTWQEKASATSQLYELRRLQAAKHNLPEPSIGSLAAEIRGGSDGSREITRREIILSRHLDDPDVAKARNVDEGYKILKRKEELKKSAELGNEVGKTFNSSMHKLWRGDCLEIMKGYQASSFDVILTDPPYGIDAQNFNDSGGRTAGGHPYDDSLPAWETLMISFSREIYHIAKEQAHAYLFCDVDNFVNLKVYMNRAGWRVFRTPLIWINPTAMRAPWPEMGPQRKWQACLYAVKGDKPVTRLYPDICLYPSDVNLNHPAQKPVELYKDLLKRSVRPGDIIIDPFCGSGTIFPAAHEMQCRAVGIELDEAAYGISVKRLAELP